MCSDNHAIIAILRTAAFAASSRHAAIRPHPFSGSPAPDSAPGPGGGLPRPDVGGRAQSRRDRASRRTSRQPRKHDPGDRSGHPAGSRFRRNRRPHHARWRPRAHAQRFGRCHYRWARRRGQPVPTLDEALATMRGRCGVYLDAKRITAERIIAALQRQKMTDRALVYAQFNRLLALMRRGFPRLATPEANSVELLPLTGETSRTTSFSSPRRRQRRLCRPARRRRPPGRLGQCRPARSHRNPNRPPSRTPRQPPSPGPPIGPRRPSPKVVPLTW